MRNITIEIMIVAGVDSLVLELSVRWKKFKVKRGKKKVIILMY